MGRYGYSESPKYFYCPKCGNKKLIKESEWHSGGYWRTWVCKHNAKSTRYRYGAPKKEKGPPCGVVIKASGRDAEIEDFHGVLGKMARINVPPIQTYLLEHDRDVHKRGLEVLYQGPLVDVVRRRHNDDGVGVALYWRKRTWDSEDDDLIDPCGTAYEALRSRAAHYIEFKGLALNYIFAGNGSVIWEKESTDPFPKGGLGKRTKAAIVEWVKGLEGAIPALLKQAKEEVCRWVKEKEFFQQELSRLTGGKTSTVRLHDYDGGKLTAQIVTRAVTPKELFDICKLLDYELTVPFTLGRTRGVSLEMAIKLEETFGKKIELDSNRMFSGHHPNVMRRVTLDEARAIAGILCPTGVPA